MLFIRRIVTMQKHGFVASLPHASRSPFLIQMISKRTLQTPHGYTFRSQGRGTRSSCLKMIRNRDRLITVEWGFISFDLFFPHMIYKRSSFLSALVLQVCNQQGVVWSPHVSQTMPTRHFKTSSVSLVRKASFSPKQWLIGFGCFYGCRSAPP